MSPDAERSPGEGSEPTTYATSSRQPTTEQGLSAGETAKVREHLRYVAAALDEIATIGNRATDQYVYQALDELDRAIWLIDGRAAA